MKEAIGRLTPLRILLYFALLAIMLLIGAVVLSTQTKLVPATATQTAPAPATAAAAASQGAETSIAQITPTIALATPWGVLGLEPQPDGAIDAAPVSATPLPDLAPIVLLGPPAESQFRVGDKVTFYWDWAETLEDGYRFTVYLQSDAVVQMVGSAEADNLGTIQQLGVALTDAAAGSYVWYVVVEEIETATILARSEQRPIVLLPDANR